MKTLLVMRHAKSSWGNANLSDHQRPLNERGHRDAPRMGKLLEMEDLTPDLIISSSAKRAFQTATHVANDSSYRGELLVRGELYLAPRETYYDVLGTVSNEHKRVMVVGHNPGIEEFVAWLVRAWETMTTANIAHIELPVSSWTEFDNSVRGKLVNYWRPKELF